VTFSPTGEGRDLESKSFDLVLCKEALHHLARPVLGLYEMLRVCRQRAVAIEPWSCGLFSLFDALASPRGSKLSRAGNIAARDNHVYHFGRASSTRCSRATTSNRAGAVRRGSAAVDARA